MPNLIPSIIVLGSDCKNNLLLRSNSGACVRDRTLRVSAAHAVSLFSVAVQNCCHFPASSNEHQVALHFTTRREQVRPQKQKTREENTEWSARHKRIIQFCLTNSLWQHCWRVFERNLHRQKSWNKVCNQKTEPRCAIDALMSNLDEELIASSIPGRTAVSCICNKGQQVVLLLLLSPFWVKLINIRRKWITRARTLGWTILVGTPRSQFLELGFFCCGHSLSARNELLRVQYLVIDANRQFIHRHENLWDRNNMVSQEQIHSLNTLCMSCQQHRSFLVWHLEFQTELHLFSFLVNMVVNLLQNFAQTCAGIITDCQRTWSLVCTWCYHDCLDKLNIFWVCIPFWFLTFLGVSRDGFWLLSRVSLSGVETVLLAFLIKLSLTHL